MKLKGNSLQKTNKLLYFAYCSNKQFARIFPTKRKGLFSNLFVLQTIQQRNNEKHKMFIELSTDVKTFHFRFNLGIYDDLINCLKINNTSNFLRHFHKELNEIKK
jgi:response regulator of citrate/malate metabolism